MVCFIKEKIIISVFLKLGKCGYSKALVCLDSKRDEFFKNVCFTVLNLDF